MFHKVIPKSLINLLVAFRYIARVRSEIAKLREEMDIIKSRMDVPDEFFNKFQQDRTTTEYQAIYDLANPLVSVCIATYNRGALLVERSIRSVLAQDYKNIEVIVIGDCCTDNTAELISQIKDNRLHFVNLAKRGEYPTNPDWRWMVAGTEPINYALSIAEGDFITHLDDDDEYSPDRIRKLLRFIRETRSDIVWHPFWRETSPNKWELINAINFCYGSVTTSSVFYHKWFKLVPWSTEAYRYQEPGDWNRFRKLCYLGVNRARYPEPLLRHYKERNQKQP